MPNTIRFHLDESCDPRIARGLRHRGVDVTTTVEAKLLQATDPEQLAHANAEERMIVTFDDDFLRLAAAGYPHSGIAYCHPESRSLCEIIARSVMVWEIYEPDEIRNRVEFL